MENGQIVTMLATLRFKRQAQREGLDEPTAILAADKIVSANREMIESCQVPEMIIVSILDTYFQSLHLSIQSGGPGFDVRKLDMKQFAYNLTGHIEKQRNRFAKGTWRFPRTLDDYVQYRVGVECKTLSKRDSDSMGLTRSVVTEMIALSTPILSKRYSK